MPPQCVCALPNIAEISESWQLGVEKISADDRHRHGGQEERG